MRIVVNGAFGRMGRAVARLAADDGRFELVGGADRETSGLLPCPIVPLSGLRRLLAGADVLIDFSSPEACLAAAAAAAAARKPAVLGTTGLSPAQRRRLAALARRIPLLHAPNMSPGMNLLFHLSALAAAALPGYDAALSETHHALKKDAPSGSALRIVEAVRAARGRGPAVPAVSLRVGDVVGEHTLTLAGPGERLELTHRAHSREVFARGALCAALWLRERRPGFYSMADALGLVK